MAGEDNSDIREAKRIEREEKESQVRKARLASIDQQIAVAQSATTAFEQQQRAFESQIAALGKPSDPSQFGQAAPDLSFTPGDFARPAFDRTPSPGVGLTTAIAASSRQGSPTAAFTLSDIQSRFDGVPRGSPRGVPKKTTTRSGGVTTTAPEGAASPIQRVLRDRTHSRLGGRGKF